MRKKKKKTGKHFLSSYTVQALNFTNEETETRAGWGMGGLLTRNTDKGKQEENAVLGRSKANKSKLEDKRKSQKVSTERGK